MAKPGNVKRDILELITVAPLAGISDSPFRSICRRFGAKYLYSEMVSSEGLWRKHKSTSRLIEVMEEDGPVVLQLFGSKPESFYKAAQILDGIDHVTEINVNAGCPVKKVLKSGSGAALMKDPPLLAKIVAEIKKATKKPISVKIRSGFDFSSINFIDCARVCKEEGASSIILHPRTAKMMFSGKADWDHIKLLRDEVKDIKLIGNGDVLDLESAKKMMLLTACDGVMVGRAIFGNPWFFMGQKKELNKEMVETMLYHVSLAAKFYGADHAYKIMKKHLIYYLKGCDAGSEKKKSFYDHITRSQNINEEIKIVEGLL